MIINQLLRKLEKADNFNNKMDIAISLIEEVNETPCMASNEIDDIMEKLENAGVEVRQCTNCGDIMIQGYVVYDGSEYYCSDTCFNEEIGLENLENMYQDDDAYWTEFN